MLLTKKSITKLGSQMNDNAGSKPSTFAMKQMEKMGWTEGKGLGKNESGISKHLSITKREEAAGLGSEAVETRAQEASETWWHDAFASNLKAMHKKHGSKKSKSKDETKDAPQPTYDELFKATGGARLGMRARAEQKGKLKRTEDEGSSSSTSASNNDTKAVPVAPIAELTAVAPEAVVVSSSSKGKKRKAGSDDDSSEDEAFMSKMERKWAKVGTKEKKSSKSAKDGKKKK